MNLSLCIATFNEEKNIHYPLDSAYDFVDEVIIVDGGSTDKTVEIAKSYGHKVKVFIEKNPPMFHINKQKAIERASGDWILQLDADETLTEELKHEIAILLNGYMVNKNNNMTIEQYNNSPKVAFWLPRKSFFLGRFLMKGGQYPDYTIRLYRNGAARFPCKTVHENVEIISQKSEVKSQNLKSKVKSSNITIEQYNNETIGYLKNPILHYADPTFSRYLMRWKRYNNLDAELLVKRSTFSVQRLTFNLGRLIGLLRLFIDYIFIKPPVTFFSMYFRHLGFLDGWQGFVFAFFSSVRYWAIYLRYVTKKLI